MHNVISDITGATGIAIIRNIAAGVTDPKALAALRDERCHNSQEVIEASLVGNYRKEHLFSLKQALELYDYYMQKISECDHQIAEQAKRLETKCDIGLDMSRWRSAKSFASWLGLCPGNKVSGGKKLSDKTKPCANRVAIALRVAANTLYRFECAFGAFLRRMKARLGSPKAITALAHKLAKLIYIMLKYGHEYVENGVEFYEDMYKKRREASLRKKAKEMGYDLVPKAA